MKSVTDPTTGEITTYTEEDFVRVRDQKLMAWEAAKTAVETAKETEMRLRKEVVAFTFDPEKTAGTERIPLANGYQLKAVKKINYGWIKDADGDTDKKRIDAALDRIEKTGNEGAFIAERIVKWQPTLSLSEYGKLKDSMVGAKIKAIIDEVIVTSEGAPTLEIVEPKAKK